MVEKEYLLKQKQPEQILALPLITHLSLTMDMMTWYLMSASRLLILSAMLRTASQHSTFLFCHLLAVFHCIQHFLLHPQIIPHAKGCCQNIVFPVFLLERYGTPSLEQNKLKKMLIYMTFFLTLLLAQWETACCTVLVTSISSSSSVLGTLSDTSWQPSIKILKFMFSKLSLWPKGNHSIS